MGNNNLYAAHIIDNGLDRYNPETRAGTLTTQWIDDRWAFLSWKNIANSNNKNAVIAPLDEPWRFDDLTQKYTVTVAIVPVPNPLDFQNHLAIFGGEKAENLTGNNREDRLYGGGSADWLEGKGGNDYLEGGSGLDVYAYSAEKNLLFPDRSDGADTILDTDATGVIRYTFSQTGSPTLNTVIAGLGVNLSGAWQSVDGRFTYSTLTNPENRTDLQIAINGQTGASITLKDFRNNDLAIALHETRGNHEYAALGAVFTGDDSPNTLTGNTTADAISGLGGSDTLRGDAGDDLVIGGSEDDLVFGDAGFDRLFGNEGRDLVYGGADDDELWGGADADILEGGPGADRLAGEAGRDIVVGDAGDDEIYAAERFNSQSELIAGVIAGETQTGSGLAGDWLDGGEGNDILVGARDNDLLAGGGGADILIGGSGNDNLVGDVERNVLSLDWSVSRNPAFGSPPAGGTYRLVYSNASVSESASGAGDELRGGEGLDWLFGGLGGDVLHGDAGDDVLFGQQGADILVGSTGNDVLVGDDPGVVSGSDEGADYLDGGAGNDILQGDGDADILIGGTGNDALRGGAGKDTYIFNKGDGADTIFDTSEGPEKSEIIYGEGFDKSSLTIKPGSLILDFGDGDSTHLSNFDVFDPNSAPAFERLHFADGTSMSFEEVIALGFDFDGTEESDDAHDLGHPMLIGTAFNDRIRGFGGNDVLAGLAGDDRLEGGAGGDQLQGNEGHDILDGGEGADALFGGEGDDVHIGGAGVDFLNGGDGNDTYAFDEQDSVVDFAGSETILFADGLDPEDIDLSIQTFNGQPTRFLTYAGLDPVNSGMAITMGLDALSRTVSYRFSDDRVLTEQEFFQTSRIDPRIFTGTEGDDVLVGHAGGDLLRGLGGSDQLSGGRGNDDLEGGAGDDTLQGGAGNDRLFGGIGTDVLVGGAGNDQLFGEGGSDTYLYARGDGQDVIADGGDTADVDTLILDGINPGDVTISRLASGDLRIALNDATGSVMVSNYYNLPTNRIERIEFADATFIDSSFLDALTVPPIVGTSGNDSLVGTQYDDTLQGLDGNDTINAGFGNDIVEGGAGSDVLNGGGGTDQLIGGAGTDTYLLSVVAGQATLVEDNSETSIIKIPNGFVFADLDVSRAGDDLVLKVRDTEGSVLVPGYYTGQTNWAVATSAGQTKSLPDLVAYLDQIAHPQTVQELQESFLEDANRKYQIYLNKYGNSGGIIVNEQSSDAQFISRVPPYYETGSNGVYYLNIAHIIAGGSANVLELGFSGVVIADGGAGDDLIYNHGWAFVDGANNIGSFLYGNDGNDQIVGSYQNDWIIGGAGSDYLNGDDGSDTFFIDTAQTGIDIIDEVAGPTLAPGFPSFAAGPADKVLFSGALTSADLSLKWDVFSYTDDAEFIRARPTLDMKWAADRGIRLVVPMAGDHAQKRIEQFEFSDGSVRTLDQFIALAPPRPTIVTGDLNDNFNATNGNDVIYSGGGNDFVAGGSGNDIINGGTGQDLLFGQDGNDALNGGSGDDSLDGFTGSDTYEFGYGGGRDVITDDFFLPLEIDTLRFLPGVLPADVTAEKSGMDLVLKLNGSTDQITVKRWLQSTGYQLDQVKFDDGTVWNVNAIWEKFPVTVITGTAGSETLTGTKGRDEIRGLDGNDLILGFESADVLDGGPGDDSIGGGAGNDILTGGEGRDGLDGGAGDDVLDARGVTANAVTETMSGGPGNDTYYFGRTSGHVVVGDNAGTSFINETDTILIDANLTPADIQLRRLTRNDMFLQINGDPTARMEVLGQFEPDGNGPNRIERIQFLSDGTAWDIETINTFVTTSTEGDDTLWGFDHRDDVMLGLGGFDTIFGLGGNDTLSGGPGIDPLWGGAGSDTYRFNIGDGEDHIIEVDNIISNPQPGDVDILRFGTGINPSDVAFLRTSFGDLWLLLGAEKVVITSFFQDPQHTVEEIYFSDGTIWTEDTVSLMVPVFGTEGDDVLQGGRLSDAINGLGGNDVLHGGAGNDTIDGGTGSDTLFGEDGDDTLIAGNGDSARAGVSNTLNGGGGNDVLIAGDTSSNQMSGDSGSDLYIGGTGSDQMSDTSGRSLFYGKGGADQLAGSDDNDIVAGGLGNDSYDGDSNANNLTGSDIVLFNRADGQDSVMRLGQATALSLGGMTSYSQLKLDRSGDALIVKLGKNNIAFSDWYSPSAGSRATYLQVMAETLRAYDPASTNPLVNQKVQVFDFQGLIAAWDLAQANNQRFVVADHLAEFRISGSDTQAYGGAVAYQYGTTGTLDALSTAQMQAAISAPEFGSQQQMIGTGASAASMAAFASFSDTADAESATVTQKAPATATPDAQEPDGGVSPVADDSGAVQTLSADENTTSSTKPDDPVQRKVQAMLDAWFDETLYRQFYGLSNFDQIISGVAGNGQPGNSAALNAAQWDRVARNLPLHLAQYAGSGLDPDENVLSSAFGNPLYGSGAPIVGAVGLSSVSGNNLKPFQGLKEGLSKLA